MIFDLTVVFQTTLLILVILYIDFHEVVAGGRRLHREQYNLNQSLLCMWDRYANQMSGLITPFDTGSALKK